MTDFMKSKALREERQGLVHQIHELAELAGKEQRPFNPDEQVKFDRLDEAQEKLKVEIDGWERTEKANQLKEDYERKSYTPNYKSAISNQITFADQENAWRAWLCGEETDQIKPRQEWKDAAAKCNFSLTQKQTTLKLPTYKDQVAFGSSGVPQSALTSSVGKELVPTLLANYIDIALKQYSGMRIASRVIRTESGSPMNFPVANDLALVGARLPENTATSVYSITTGSRQLNAWMYSSKAVVCPYDLLQDSAFNVAQFVGELLGQRIGRIQNYEFTNLSSTAVGGPTGLLSAVNGITHMSTLTWDTTSKVNYTYNNVLSLIHSVDPAYRVGAKFMFSDSMLHQVRGMVDTIGRPIFQTNISVGSPDTILNYEYVVNNDMPPYGVAGNKCAAFGDFNRYVIRDAQDLILKRLDGDVYTMSAQVAFVAFQRSDAKYVSAGNAINYMVCGSST